LIKYIKKKVLEENKEQEKVNLFTLNHILQVMSSQRDINARDMIIINGEIKQFINFLNKVTTYPSPKIVIDNFASDLVQADKLLQNIHSLWSFKTNCVGIFKNEALRLR